MPPPAVHASFAPQLSLYGARDLLFNLVKAELTARYKTATFGIIWFLANPALTSGVLFIVFQGVIQLSIERYHVFLLVALMPWTYFQMGLTNAVTSLTRAPGMVKRVKIPRVLLPVATILASLVHFVIALVPMILLLLVSGVEVRPAGLLLLPFIVMLHTAGLIGMGIAAASLNVLYRDVEHLILVVLRLGFWLTPIFYPFDYVPERWRLVALLNPMTGLIECYRAALLHNTMPDARVIISVVILAFVCLAVGVALFVRLDPYMDDHV